VDNDKVSGRIMKTMELRMKMGMKTMKMTTKMGTTTRKKTKMKTMELRTKKVMKIMKMTMKIVMEKKMKKVSSTSCSDFFSFFIGMVVLCISKPFDGGSGSLVKSICGCKPLS